MMGRNYIGSLTEEGQLGEFIVVNFQNAFQYCKRDSLVMGWAL